MLKEATTFLDFLELHHLFESRLNDLGIEKSINKTRLKLDLLNHFLGDCQEQSDGKSVLLVFNEGMKKLLREVADTARDYTSDALMMTSVVKLLRQDILAWKSFKFTGDFLLTAKVCLYQTLSSYSCLCCLMGLMEKYKVCVSPKLHLPNLSLFTLMPKVSLQVQLKV